MKSPKEGVELNFLLDAANAGWAEESRDHEVTMGRLEEALVKLAAAEAELVSLRELKTVCEMRVGKDVYGVHEDCDCPWCRACKPPGGGGTT